MDEPCSRYKYSVVYKMLAMTPAKTSLVESIVPFVRMRNVKLVTVWISLPQTKEPHNQVLQASILEE